MAVFARQPHAVFRLRCIVSTVMAGNKSGRDDKEKARSSRRDAMPSLKGKIAWVTGAGSGIGAAAAAALAEAGAAVVLTGRRREPLEKVAGGIAKAGGTAHVQPGDLMSASAVEKIAAFIKDKFGRLDIL